MDQRAQASELNERQQMVLQAIVHTYITTAEPVGSRTIVKRFGLDWSSATVRNVMADLEEAGFVQQLHTSSGRVPTDRGYRYYVDYLMRVQELTLAERGRIEQELTERISDADEVMRQTSHLLALISHQTGLVEAPNDEGAEIRHIELIPVSATRMAVLLADNCGRVRTQMVTLGEPLPVDHLGALTQFLNGQLRGTAINQLAASLEAGMPAFLDEKKLLAEAAMRVVGLLPGPAPVRLFLDGTMQLFEQPEFRDVGRAQEVFTVLEEQRRLVEILRGQMRERGPAGASVVIGSESHEPGLEDISVVASPYHVSGRTVGMLGVLGPRRMPYSRLTAIVDYTASLMGRLLTQLTG